MQILRLCFSRECQSLPKKKRRIQFRSVLLQKLRSLLSIDQKLDRSQSLALTLRGARVHFRGIRSTVDISTILMATLQKKDLTPRQPTSKSFLLPQEFKSSQKQDFQYSKEFFPRLVGKILIRIVLGGILK